MVSHDGKRTLFWMDLGLKPDLAICSVLLGNIFQSNITKESIATSVQDFDMYLAVDCSNK